ncbi:hypothetical protein AMTRI_Chr10g229060 [Amborella trichopoda]
MNPHSSDPKGKHPMELVPSNRYGPLMPIHSSLNLTPMSPLRSTNVPEYLIHTPPQSPSSTPSPAFSPASYPQKKTSTSAKSIYIDTAFLPEVIISDDHAQLDPYKIAPLYLSNHMNSSYGIKTREWYEAILMETGSVSIVHFYQGTTKLYAYSKLQVKKLLSYEDWGCNPLQGKRLLNPEFPYKSYKYSEYIEAWHKVFAYQNPNNTHTWYIQFKLPVLERFPSWFRHWFLIWGSQTQILPDAFQNLQTKFAQHNTCTDLDDYHLYFMAIYQIPWILKWEYSISENNTNNYEYIPQLGKTVKVKWWDIFSTNPTTLPLKRMPPQPETLKPVSNNTVSLPTFSAYLKKLKQTHPNATFEEIEQTLLHVFAPDTTRPATLDETVQSGNPLLEDFSQRPTD